MTRLARPAISPTGMTSAASACGAPISVACWE
jgi:hypothetical protein